jgi:hypothetical protein
MIMNRIVVSPLDVNYSLPCRTVAPQIDSPSFFIAARPTILGHFPHTAAALMNWKASRREDTFESPLQMSDRL